ncbi:hypothetical protein Bhyg_12053 [Pseudolycoriella hygida]|uniref:Regulatory protein zeste n=1 Tax=Pseudolycoriella hygida TaxID=35572 RepID=A0A9Q0MY28_9DIPT|nr:hypothetical protein Bhyg_12053 [Pseudolycoriella hygida]
MLSEGSSDGECKENKMPNQVFVLKQPRVSKQQYDEIEAFYQDHSEESIGRDVFKALWQNLAEKLNAMGPPVLTESEWRRKWAVQKYNRKKNTRLYVTEYFEPESSSDRPSDQSSRCSEFHTKVLQTQQQILQKLDEISTRQSSIIKKLDAIEQGSENK